MVIPCRAVLAHDLALVLRMEKRLFCRLVSRIISIPPVVSLVPPTSWPPPIPTVKRIWDPLTLTTVEPLVPSDEPPSLIDRAANDGVVRHHGDCQSDVGIARDAVESASSEEKQVVGDQVDSRQEAVDVVKHGCWLGGQLIGSSTGARDVKIAVALTRTHLALLLEATELGLYEETLSVDVQALKSFIHVVVKPDVEQSLHVLPSQQGVTRKPQLSKSADVKIGADSHRAPAFIAKAFPDLYKSTGERRLGNKEEEDVAVQSPECGATQSSVVRSQKRVLSDKTKATASEGGTKGEGSKRSRKRRKLEDDGGLANKELPVSDVPDADELVNDDEESDDGKPTMSWSALRRSKRWKSRRNRHHGMADTPTKDNKEDRDERSKRDEDSDCYNSDENTEWLGGESKIVDYSEEELRSLPKDRLQLLLDSLMTNVEVLYERALCA